MECKIYWKPRGSSFAWVGKGSTIKPGSPQFGGVEFAPGSCRGVWKDFPSSLFTSFQSLIREIWTPSEPTFSLPHIVSRRDTPSFDEWWVIVNNALDKIEKEEFKKVVLARQTTLTFDGKIDPEEVLKLLTPLGSQASLFLFQLDEETAFVGATPETLYHRTGSVMTTEALAGTKAAEELWGPKEFSEIDAVQVYLQNRLMRFCSEIAWHSPEQKQYGTIQHLYQKIEGKLKQPMTDETIIAELHPTPALGGFPRQEAVDYISEVEPFPRGWYGGLFGMTSTEETELSVAIRSALIRGNEMHLFAGAGIVKGSKPEKEWEELERKISHFMRKL